VTSEPLRLGIVGCGGISERHARAAAGSAAAAIVACCDIRAGAAEDWAARHGCERAYADYRAMIREHELDGVLLATWPNLHHEQVLGCLEEGVRAVLCEKSLAVTGAEALEIWTAADEADALVVEGLMYLHHPAIRRIDELLAAGELGEIDSVRAVFSLVDTEESAPDDPSRDWRQRADRAGGVPYDLACYCVDACNRLAGAPPRSRLPARARATAPSRGSSGSSSTGTASSEPWRAPRESTSTMRSRSTGPAVVSSSPSRGGSTTPPR
jgi:predicted dehydrogenase